MAVLVRKLAEGWRQMWVGGRLCERGRPVWDSGAGAELGLDVGELAVALRCLDVGGYLAAAVDDCGVIAVAKETADQLEGELGVLAEEIHSDVAGLGDGPGPARAQERRGRHAEVAGHAFDDRLR